MSVRTTRITVETETFTVVRRARVDVGWCPGCNADVDVICVGEQGALDAATTAQIAQWRRTNELHCWHIADGSMHMCVKSLMRSIEEGHAQTLHLPGSNSIVTGKE